jgi:hypothetical protein
MRCVFSLTLAALLLAAGALHAAPAEVEGHPLPPGWVPVATPALHGSFRQSGHEDIAVLAQQGATYGVLVVPGEGHEDEVSVARTFGSSAANPPQLSLVHPGNYTPACHDGDACAPVDIPAEAIGLCHGEASCEIVYFKDHAFHHLTITD